MRITDFPELVTATGNDLLVTVDIANDLTKKIKLENLPTSIATTAALAAKQNLLVSGTNIKTLNSVSLLGSGDIVLAATPSGVAGAIQFSNGSAFASDATNFFWDDTNNRLGIGTNAPTSRLQVRGDGTNPVARFESSAGANFLLINNSGQAVFGSAGANEPYLVNYNGTLTESAGGHSLRIRQRANTGSTGNTLIQYWADGLFSGTTSGIAISHEFLSSGFSGAAGSGNYRNLSIGYTINNSGAQTGTATGIFLNATETALNGQTHNLIDLQAGGLSRFKVNNVGIVTGTTYVSANEYQFSVGTRIRSVSNGIITLGNNDLTNFSLLTFGNTTSSFPAIKRNGTAIDFRLADDSGYCDINVKQFNTNVGSGIISGSFNGGALGTYISFTSSVGNQFDLGSEYGVFGSGTGTDSAVIARASRKLYIGSNGVKSIFCDAIGSVGITLGGAINTSAIFQVDSTTKGFLPPRMTTAQKNAISSPATGLVVFDTDLGKLCVFSVTWQTVTSI